MDDVSGLRKLFNFLNFRVGNNPSHTQAKCDEEILLNNNFSGRNGLGKQYMSHFEIFLA